MCGVKDVQRGDVRLARVGYPQAPKVGINITCPHMTSVPQRLPHQADGNLANPAQGRDPPGLTGPCWRGFQPSGIAGPDQASLIGVDDCVRPVAECELGQDSGDVRLDCRFADYQVTRDGGI
jgi:hypothetical protein